MNNEWPPRWWGKQFHNELVTMPESEQKRILQILTAKTKRTALKQCLVPGEHGGPTVEGHDVQRAVMRRWTEKPYVMAFSQNPLVDDMRFPDEVPINHALTGYFTCRNHEGLFSDVERCVPEFENERHLILLAYKALLKAMWDIKVQLAAFESMEKADPKSDFPNYMVRLCRKKESGIGYYKRLTEVMLGIAQQPSPYDEEPDVIKHFVVPVPSRRPSIAVSSWTNGLRWWVERGLDDIVVEKIGQWGCTVYPLQNEHILIYHFPSADESIIRKATWHVRNADAETLQRRVSCDLLGRMEGIVVYPEVWEAYTDERKDAIKDYFRSTMPRTDLSFPDAPPVLPVENWHSKRLRLVNLFD